MWLWAGICGGWGCSGSPQVGVANIELVEALATATSTRRGDLLERCAGRAKEAREEGTLSAEAFEEVESILATARGGDWERARERAYRLRDGQSPEAESGEVERKLPPLKKRG